MSSLASEEAATGPVTAGGDEARTPEQAWRAWGPAALRFATALVGPHDAHDITTTAFLRATSGEHWHQIESFDRYLLRAVRNEAKNLWRQRRRRWRRDLAAVTASTIHDTPADLDVLEAIAALSLAQRSVVYLAYWEDRTEAEIAEILDLARSTVHRTLVRARNNLRKALQ